VLAGVTPDACGDCGAVGLWTYEPPEPEPVLVLSESDVRFLRQQRIAVEQQVKKELAECTFKPKVRMCF
jgi:hypothetical protein